MKRSLLIGEVVYRLQNQKWPVPGEGACDGRSLRITVDAQRGRADETLIHEIFHACEYELVRTGRLDRESPERYVEAMATMLYRTLERNGFLSMDVEWDQLELFDILEANREKTLRVGNTD